MIHPIAFPAETDALAGVSGRTGEELRQAYRTVRPASELFPNAGNYPATALAQEPRGAAKFRTVANDDARPTTTQRGGAMTCTHTIRSRITGLTTRFYADGLRLSTSGRNPWVTAQRGLGPAWVIEAVNQRAAIARALATAEQDWRAA